MDNSIILFRFYEEFEVCAERIKLLKALNPAMPIYGLYGGTKENFGQARAVLKDYLVDIQISPPNTRNWKWLHPDLNLKTWYRDFGESVSFDYLYDYEHDILTTVPLSQIYPTIGQDTIALCALDKFTPEIEKYWHWTSHPNERPKFQKFMRYMGDKYDLSSLNYASLGPGPLLSHKFLDAYAKTEDIDFVLVEIAYPAYAQALGFNLKDNGFRPEGFNTPFREEFFNCNNVTVPRDTVIKELSKPTGIRAFHPVKYMVKADEIINFYESAMSS